MRKALSNSDYAPESVERGVATFLRRMFKQLGQRTRGSMLQLAVGLD
jgi:hypothetical protein